MNTRTPWSGLCVLVALLAFGSWACNEWNPMGDGPSDRGEPTARDTKSEPLSPYPRTAHGTNVRCWTSFGKFKRAMVKEGMGKRGRDYQWHHIVPQHADNKTKFKERNLHCTDNLVYLHKDEHTKLNRYYSTSQPKLGDKSFRDWLKPMSFDEQRIYGLRAMRELGIEITENPGVSF